MKFEVEVSDGVEPTADDHTSAVAGIIHRALRDAGYPNVTASVVTSTTTTKE